MLAVHSGAGAAGYAAREHIPEQVAAMVYVDSGPATGPCERPASGPQRSVASWALDPDFDAIEIPLPSWEELEESFDGLSDEQLETFRQRAVPEPGCALREGPELTNDPRLDVPSTVICTSLTSDQVKAAVEEGDAWIGGLAELRDVTYVDLPTSHWPMWSGPKELAAVIADVARRASTG